MAQNMRIRDTKIADDVYKKKELGWLDQEFTAYGTAYYENGEMCYRVSNHSKKIYSFMDEEGVRDIYFGNLIRHTERCPLPVGMKEEKNLEIKKTLAKTLEKEYPQELFLLLQMKFATILLMKFWSKKEKNSLVYSMVCAWIVLRSWSNTAIKH